MHAIVIFTKIEGFSQYCLQRNFIKNKISKTLLNLILTLLIALKSIINIT